MATTARGHIEQLPSGYARRVGIASSLKELRHYSATQLLAAGADLNTVAGCLGHAEGSTTLKSYAHFTGPPTSAPPR